MGRRVMIVFEETGGAGLNVYLEGQTKGIRVHTPGDDLSPADFYASRMLAIVVEALTKAGALRAVGQRS
jgi:hypothetical protein